MKITFVTQTKSVYELDIVNKAIRRLSGVLDPTPRQGVDGEWKTFQSASQPVIGESVLLVWRTDNEDGTTILRSTLTSPVETTTHAWPSSS